MEDKKLRLRKCVACNEMKSRDELFRLVRTVDSSIEVDRTHKMNGRGAYVCKDVKCIELAQKKKSFNRALKNPVREEVIKELLMELENGSR